jgi:hypothetical protein
MLKIAWNGRMNDTVDDKKEHCAKSLVTFRNK